MPWLPEDSLHLEAVLGEEFYAGLHDIGNLSLTPRSLKLHCLTKAGPKYGCNVKYWYNQG